MIFKQQLKNSKPIFTKFLVLNRVTIKGLYIRYKKRHSATKSQTVQRNLKHSLAIDRIS